MSKISIPDPCHEDWNKMTPTERGAFCTKCQIDVVDFTGKTGDEIKSILIENRGQHLCGHIKKSQMDRLNYDFYAWENQSARTFQSKFLLACVLVFGMALFTGCETDQGDAIEVGMIEYIPDDSTSYNENEGQHSISTELKGRFVETDCDSDNSTSTNMLGQMKCEPADATLRGNVKATCTDADSIDSDDFYDDILIDGLMDIDDEFFDSIPDEG